jgi:CRP-like cAMP-binding protein
MAAERFTNLSMRVQIGILGKGQYFGDSEFLERRRRATQAKCLCDGTLLFRMDYNVTYGWLGAYLLARKWISEIAVFGCLWGVLLGLRAQEESG